MALERRKSFRIQWNSEAIMSAYEGDWSAPCILSEFSADGARISGVIVSDAPDHFVLRMARGVKPRNCRVLWRSPEALGVGFTDHAASERQTDSRTATPMGRRAHA
jgi:hypothetical protein